MWKSDEKLLTAKEYVCIYHITTTEVQDVISTMRTFTQLSLNHRLCSLLGCLTNFQTLSMESAVLLVNLHQLFPSWQGELSHFFPGGGTEETRLHMLSSPPHPAQKQNICIENLDPTPANVWTYAEFYSRISHFDLAQGLIPPVNK